jgi:heme-degrading monooxygenase HmoA
MQMIIREWRGRTSSAKAGEYPAYFHKNLMPLVRALPGFIGAELSQREFGDGIEFLVLTRWQSVDSIQNFAGSDITRAIVEPEGVAALVEFDATANHYQAILDA